jgi:hypothetical protein
MSLVEGYVFVAFVDAFVYGLSFALALERVLTKFGRENSCL